MSQRGERAILGIRRAFADPQPPFHFETNLAAKASVLQRAPRLIRKSGEQPLIEARRGLSETNGEQPGDLAADHQWNGDQR